MSDTVISVENLSKCYLIGHQSTQRERYTALRDVIARETSNFRRKALDFFRGRQIVQGDEVEEFWALRDVSFDVKRGEVLGIIGRNGAGKTTLLKILSRITEPTKGRAIMRGRVASLLEVGTGFHPELTGRENVFLNGSILGMSEAEIKSKFDEIVAFADVERFLDTPVKRYSSGMYIRLAFAVAAHLQPEILVVDEVLAVGDSQFQKKCLGKMDEVAKGGRTVLFVSHDMKNATALCTRGILLNAGAVEQDGPMAMLASLYLTDKMNLGEISDLSNRYDRSGSGDAHFQSIELSTERNRRRTFVFREPFSQRIGVRVKKRIGTAFVAATILSSEGLPVYRFVNSDEACDWLADVGDYEFEITIPQLLLYPGEYSIDLWLGDRNMHRIDNINQAISFTVIQDQNSGLERTLDSVEGLVYQRASWKQVKH